MINFSKRFALRTLTAACCTLLSAPLLAAEPSFLTTESVQATCAAQKRPAAGMTLQEQQAFVICNDIALVRHVATFVHSGINRYEQEHPTDREISFAIRAELTYIRDQLRKSRQMLERIQLGKSNAGIQLRPSQWEIDFNGNGEVERWERNFFVIPAKKQAEGERTARMNSTIKLDQADIYWMLSYHYFMESVPEILLSYSLQSEKFDPDNIVLTDPSGMKRANQLMVQGMQVSEKMRRSLLAETDDELEWIPNTKQHNSAFPVALDDQDFLIWGKALSLAIPLFQGKTLLPVNDQVPAIFTEQARLCRTGEGINIQKFFMDPPKRPWRQYNEGGIQRYCQKVDSKRPASTMMTFLKSYAERGTEDAEVGMGFLRHLLWVN